MGLICDQVDSTLNNEVNNEDKQLTSNPLTSRRRRKLVKQSTHKPRHFLHNLFKWYFKSRVLQDETASDYEIAQLSCNDDEANLAYRQQQKHPHQTRTTKDPPSISNPSISHSHYLVRQSICLYAASSVILALCYLATPSSAAPENPSHPLWVSRCVRICVD